MKRVLKLLLILIAIIVSAFVILIFFATVTDYKPEEKSVVFESKAPTTIKAGSKLSFMIWNIGYCGLSDDMDFFYDGGTQVRTSEENVKDNLNKVIQFLGKNNSDFMLFQEVDKSSARSYYVDEFYSISKFLGNYYGGFGINYNVKFVPLPFTSPLGKVFSGLGTFSKNIPESTVRYSFPGNYDWPKGLFMLDRCFLVSRYAVSDGKELLVINTHNSAYDDGSLRKGQMDYLKNFLLSEYKKGNYIVVAGDWNQCPPEFKPGFDTKLFDTDDYSLIEKDYLPSEWTWFYDDKTPTNRRLQIPYDPAKSLVTMIDFYLLSPNLKGNLINTKNLDFKNSDHQPVFAEIELK